MKMNRKVMVLGLVGTMLLGSGNTFAYEQEIYDIKPLV